MSARYSGWNRRKMSNLPPALVHLAHDDAADGGFNGLLNPIDVHSVTSQGRPVQLDDQVVLSRELLGLDVHGSLHTHQDLLHLGGEILEGVSVLPEDPHRQLGPGPGDQLVQVVGDGLGEVEGDPGNILQLMADLILDLLQTPSFAMPTGAGPSG